MSKPSREYIHGINPCFEVLRAGRREVFEAYLNRATPDNPRLKKLATFADQKGIPVQWVDKSRLFELAESREHQGAVLKTKPYPYVTSASQFGAPRLLLLDNLEDPHNVGAILRCAEVFGFHDVMLSEKGTPEIYPSVVKVSTGATEHLRISRDESANRLARTAVEQEYTVVSLDAAGNTSLEEIRDNYPEKLFLVVGGEAKAVGQFILNLSNFIAAIPQSGRVNSLNASVAAGIAMYALRPKNS